jgi:hypothetical protein
MWVSVVFAPIDVRGADCVVVTMAEGQEYRRRSCCCRNRDGRGRFCTQRQPHEALMHDAWTHEQIMSAWYWRAQSCYYSFVMPTRQPFVDAGPSLLPKPSTLPRAVHETTTSHHLSPPVSLHVNSPTHCISDHLSDMQMLSRPVSALCLLLC